MLCLRLDVSNVNLANLSFNRWFFIRGNDHEVEFHEIEIPNNAFWNFDLMIEVSTSWSILLDKFDLMNKHNFDLMIENSISWKSWILISWNSTSWSFPVLGGNYDDHLRAEFPPLFLISSSQASSLGPLVSYWWLPKS